MCDIDDQMITNAVDIQNYEVRIDSSHQVLFNKLITKEQWPRTEVDELCKELGLMLDGAIETINDWSFDKVDAPVIDEDGDGEQVETGNHCAYLGFVPFLAHYLNYLVITVAEKEELRLRHLLLNLVIEIQRVGEVAIH